MGPGIGHWGMAYLSVVVWTYLKPEQTLFNSVAWTIAVSFAVISLFWLLYRSVLYPEFFTPLKHIPTPPGRHWLKGNANMPFSDDIFEKMEQWEKTIPNDGLIRYYISSNLERVVMTNPKALSEVLAQRAYDFVKPDILRLSLGRITGIGVLLAEGTEHKVQRKNLMPAFSFRRVKDLYPVFWKKSTEMVKLIEKQLKSKEDAGEDNVVRMVDWASRATLDIIGVAGMDHDFQSLYNPDNELNRQYRLVGSEPSVMANLLFVISLLTSWTKLTQTVPFKRNREIQEAAVFIRNVARQMVRQKKEKLESKDFASGNDVDIVSVALQSGVFTEENLVDQMMTFLGAGHETTSSALQWAIYSLCKHQDVQSRLREEIRTNLPSISTEDPKPISAAAVDALPYLNAVCNEVLRFHPPVRITFRIAGRDTTVVGQPIPKDTFLVITPELINHDKSLWGDDADQFNPERWMGPGRANTGGASSNYASLTFLEGPRSCIGQGFSKSELACLVAATVGRFHMELPEPDKKLELARKIAVTPKDGTLAKFTALEGW